MNWISQVVAVTGFAVRTVPRRWGSSLAAAFGIAGVVAVLVGVLSIAQGIARTMAQSADDANAIVLRSGSTDEMTSILSNDDVKFIADAPGIARTGDGALVSGELFVLLELDSRSTGTAVNVPLRGLQKGASAIRRDWTIVEGRSFEWGRNEVVVGRGAQLEFAGLNVGNLIEVGDASWEVVGVFTAAGGVAESEVWADAAVVQPAYRRGNSFQTAAVKLESAAAFQGFKDHLTTDPRLSVKVQRQSDFYAEQGSVLTALIKGLGTLIASLMALGAIFGALNTMYTAVSARTREIATLRALGFGAGPIVISVLAESLALAVIGGLVGGGAAYLAFDGFRAATLNWASFSQVAFAFDVTPGLLVHGTVYAAVIGLVGGFFPAVRAARMPVATALREH
jgi:putative ABC transport system permease protein